MDSTINQLKRQIARIEEWLSSRHPDDHQHDVHQQRSVLRRLNKELREEIQWQREWQRERAMEAGMGLGIQAYNDHMGW